MADGQVVFAKAISPVPNPHTPSLHRREATIVSDLPQHAPVPRLLWTYDEGEEGWIVLVFEYVHGRHPFEPWRPHELKRVLEGLRQLSTALTPSPLGSDRAGTASEVVATSVRGWRWLRDIRPSNLDDWSTRHLERLVALEEEAPRAVAGATLLHMDIRADNLLLAIAGFFTHRSLQPPPPGLPTVREFQAAQALVARQWLSERLKWT